MSDQDILDVANKAELTYAELHNLYGELRILQVDIENQERIANTNDFTIQAQFVLKRWRQMNGDSATRKVILEALQESRCNRAKQILKKKWGIAEKGRSLFIVYMPSLRPFLPRKVAILLILCYECLMHFNSLIIISSMTINFRVWLKY